MGVAARAMSRGTRQKLGLLLALAHEPQVLILDEPSTGLDPLNQRELEAYLRERAEAGCTVFFSSHLLGEVAELCEQVAILRQGTLVACERLESLRARSPREVRIRWSAGVRSEAIDAPAFLEELERDRHTWRALIAGSVMELVRWAANQPMADLTIGEPDLQSLFRRHYREGTA